MWNEFLLYIRQNGNWKIIGGLKTLKLSVSNNQMAIGSVNNHGWNEWMNKAGNKSINIYGSGVISNNSGFEYLENLAISNEIAYYKLALRQDKNLIGKFQISNFQVLSDMELEELYEINLHSSGIIEFS